MTKPHQDQSRKLEHCNGSESSAALHSAPYGESVLFNLGHKVFLSHSGRDKNFVRHLKNEIRRSYHGIEVVFVDEKSISKGKAINMEKSILEEVKMSVLCGLVFIDGFFMYTRNFMLELEAFTAGKVDLLLLLFKMSVDEFKEKQRWNRWEKKWKNWRTYNGLEFCKIAPDGREGLYIDEVVRQVARIIGLVAPMSGKDVYGNDNLFQMVDDMYKERSSKRSSAIDRIAPEIASTFGNLGLGENSGLYTYDMVGIHGFSGLGKTTL